VKYYVPAPIAPPGRAGLLLKNKNAVIYGAGGSIGGAVARAFAREGAMVFLTGRALGTVDIVAQKISAAGGAVETARVNALDEEVIEMHAGAAHVQKKDRA
ncbi:MAG: hypothetical protein ACRD1G_16035, partial [Acidimicrobiales bacterium]